LSKFIIFGGSKGFGYEVASILLKEGHEVTTFSRTLESTRRGKLSFRSLDVRRLDYEVQIKSLLEEFYLVKNFIFNIGGSFGCHSELPTPEQLEFLFRTNFYYVVAAVNYLESAGRLRDSLLVFVLTNVQTKVAGNIGYYIAKLALENFSEYLELKLSYSQAKILKIAPPLILYDHRFLTQQYRLLDTEEERNEFINTRLGGMKPIEPEALARDIVDQINSRLH